MKIAPITSFEKYHQIGFSPRPFLIHAISTNKTLFFQNTSQIAKSTLLPKPIHKLTECSYSVKALRPQTAGLVFECVTCFFVFHFKFTDTPIGKNADPPPHTHAVGGRPCCPQPVKSSNCTSKDHRDKIKVPDPVVKDLISSKL